MADRIRLWLDDVRKMPARFTHHARTAAEAIEILEANLGNIEAVSLDHDLGQFDQSFAEGTGYQVACWILKAAEDGRLGPIELKCHSWNPVGKDSIEFAFAKTKMLWEARR